MHINPGLKQTRTDAVTVHSNKEPKKSETRKGMLWPRNANNDIVLQTTKASLKSVNEKNTDSLNSFGFPVDTNQYSSHSSDVVEKRLVSDRDSNHYANVSAEERSSSKQQKKLFLLLLLFFKEKKQNRQIMKTNVKLVRNINEHEHMFIAFLLLLFLAYTFSNIHV